MAKGQNIVQGRAGGAKPPVTSRPTPAAAPAPAPRRSLNPVQFYNEVKAEARKVTWTSWKETWITSIMVGIMVVATATFFFGVDALVGWVMSVILKFANAE